MRCAGPDPGFLLARAKRAPSMAQTSSAISSVPCAATLGRRVSTSCPRAPARRSWRHKGPNASVAKAAVASVSVSFPAVVSVEVTGSVQRDCWATSAMRSLVLGDQPVPAGPLLVFGAVGLVRGELCAGSRQDPVEDAACGQVLGGWRVVVVGRVGGDVGNAPPSRASAPALSGA